MTWLSYTYYFVRAMRNPLVYGISWDTKALTLTIPWDTKALTLTIPWDTKALTLTLAHLLGHLGPNPNLNPSLPLGTPRPNPNPNNQSSIPGSFDTAVS